MLGTAKVKRSGNSRVYPLVGRRANEIILVQGNNTGILFREYVMDFIVKIGDSLVSKLFFQEILDVVADRSCIEGTQYINHYGFILSITKRDDGIKIINDISLSDY